MNISKFKTEEDFNNAPLPQEGFYLQWLRRLEDGSVVEYIKNHLGEIQAITIHPSSLDNYYTKDQVDLLISTTLATEVDDILEGENNG